MFMHVSGVRALTSSGEALGQEEEVQLRERRENSKG